jgi:hypothetical protein
VRQVCAEGKAGAHTESLENGGLARNRTGIEGFAVLCVTTPPRGRSSNFAFAWSTPGSNGIFRMALMTSANAEA